MNTPQLSSLPFLAAICSLLLLASVALSGTSRRVGVPVILPFLGLGLLASSTSLGVVLRQSYHVSFVLGTLSLVLILFDGGLNTPCRWHVLLPSLRSFLQRLGFSARPRCLHCVRDCSASRGHRRSSWGRSFRPPTLPWYFPCCGAAESSHRNVLPASWSSSLA